MSIFYVVSFSKEENIFLLFIVHVLVHVGKIASFKKKKKHFCERLYGCLCVDGVKI